MGTKNKAVTAYLPADIEALLAEYCLEHGLSRQGKKSGKEKPALGTGIVEVLRHFFGTAMNGNGSGAVIDKEEIEKIVSQTLPSNVPTEAWVKAEIEQAIAALKSELGGAETTVESANGKAKAEPKKTKATKTEKTESKPAKAKLLLNQADLARRLSSNASTLSRHEKKGESHFAQWSKAKDPDGLAWQFDGIQENSKVFTLIK
ncbi:hypothetical protein [[Limnothrix rosea] IAM M-220]|uniref:hypothetical protein n=1 Tax=[Limnothrix rosea] IAM M-220 TaxID=454133 RepID=UPI001CED6108|nr:hypothetical protein [[Limnothrix rosea] IAM M-220]